MSELTNERGETRRRNEKELEQLVSLSFTGPTLTDSYTAFTSSNGQVWYGGAIVTVPATRLGTSEVLSHPGGISFGHQVVYTEDEKLVVAYLLPSDSLTYLLNWALELMIQWQIHADEVRFVRSNLPRLEHHTPE